MRLAAAALAVALCAGSTAAEDGDAAVDASPEAKAVVEKARALLIGPTSQTTQLDVPLDAVVGGKVGEAAVAVPMLVAIGPGGRDVRVGGPDGGDGARVAKLAIQHARVGVELLVGGMLPYPWDAWKGELDEDGVLHALFVKAGKVWGGVEMTFDERGLPATSKNLMAAKDGSMRPAAEAKFEWEAAGGRFRLKGMRQATNGREVLRCSFRWGPPDETMPRTWTCILQDRVVRLARKGFAPSAPAAIDPMLTYALDPRPADYVQWVKKRGDALVAPTSSGSDLGDFVAVALGAILRAEPSRVDEATAALAKAGVGPARVLIRAISRALDEDRAATLEKLRGVVPDSLGGEIDAAKRGLPRPLESAVPMNAVPEGPSALDRCWSLYFVSGDPAALRPIVGALKGLDASDAAGLVIGGAAQWSLTSNARQWPAVRELLERDLPVVPAAVRGRVEQILAKAAEPAKSPAPAPDAPK